jgi:hypothetical protein
VYKILKDVLDSNLTGIDKYKQEDINNLNKKVCEEVKAKLKEPTANIKRYKFLVHCIIGEKKGQGIRMGNKCLWDTSTDSMVSAYFENEVIFGVVSAFGIYYY